MDAADTAEAEAGVAAMGIGAKAAEGGDGTGTTAAERPPAHVSDGGEPDAIPETPRPGGAEQEPVRARARARAAVLCAIFGVRCVRADARCRLVCSSPRRRRTRRRRCLSGAGCSMGCTGARTLRCLRVRAERAGVHPGR